MPIFLGIAAVVALGYALDKSGEGIKDAGAGLDRAGTGALKLSVGGAALFLILKHTKVI